MSDENLLESVTSRKLRIDKLTDDLASRIARMTQQIKEANSDSPDLPRWQAEMRHLQDRFVTEPEAETRSLCDEIQRITGLSEVFKRNTDATNQNLKGEAWAKFVLEHIT